MASVLDWMLANGVEDVDVYDSVLDIGRAWGTPYGPDAVRAVQAWILGGCEVVDEDDDGLVADVWGFVEKNLGAFAEYAGEWTPWRVDGTDSGLSHGVVIAMYLMSGEAALASYPRLAERIAEASE